MMHNIRQSCYWFGTTQDEQREGVQTGIVIETARARAFCLRQGECQRVEALTC